jgi:hypothetical protein
MVLWMNEFLLESLTLELIHLEKTSSIQTPLR